MEKWDESSLYIISLPTRGWLQDRTKTVSRPALHPLAKTHPHLPLLRFPTHTLIPSRRNMPKSIMFCTFLMIGIQPQLWILWFWVEECRKELCGFAVCGRVMVKRVGSCWPGLQLDWDWGRERRQAEQGWGSQPSIHLRLFNWLAGWLVSGCCWWGGREGGSGRWISERVNHLVNHVDHVAVTLVRRGTQNSSEQQQQHIQYPIER